MFILNLHLHCVEPENGEDFYPKLIEFLKENNINVFEQSKAWDGKVKTYNVRSYA